MVRYNGFQIWLTNYLSNGQTFSLVDKTGIRTITGHDGSDNLQSWCAIMLHVWKVGTIVKWLHIKVDTNKRVWFLCDRSPSARSRLYRNIVCVVACGDGTIPNISTTNICSVSHRTLLINLVSINSFVLEMIQTLTKQ